MSSHYLPTPSRIETGKQVRSGGYTYINPLIECEVDTDEDGRAEYTAIEKSLTDYISQQTAEGKIMEAGIYFRDLNNGPTFGVNSSLKFSPASLLKLPVMMAYFHAAQKDPAVLKQSITYTTQQSLLSQAFSKSSLKVGESYTVEALIEEMITHSDNEALSLLGGNIDVSLVHKVTEDLGITTPKDPYAEDFMSVKQYASLFRVLYNSSYLDREYSEKALGILSKTDFKKGLVAGVPANVTVAHKYGERELESGVNQLHDCGIFYTSKPYLLCVMTRGNDDEALALVIQNVSKQVYIGIDKGK